MSQNMNLFYRESFESVNTAQDMQEAIQTGQKQLLWSCTTSDKSETEKRITNVEAALQKLRDDYKILTEKIVDDTQKIDNFEEIMDSTEEVRDKVIQLSKEQKVDESIKTYDEEYAQHWKRRSSHFSHTIVYGFEKNLVKR